MNEERAAEPSPAPYVAYLALGAMLLAVGGVGYLAFLAFVKGGLAPEAFAAYGLVLVTVAAAVASFFSPCSFTVLPSYIAFASSLAATEAQPLNKRVGAAAVNGLVAALGVVTAVVILGAIIGVLGTGFAPSLSIAGPEPNLASRALRIAVGAFVASMGLLHLLNLSHRLPLVGRISAGAIELGGQPHPSLRSAYLYGAGYVLVGIG